MRMLSNHFILATLAAVAAACSGTGHIDVAVGASSALTAEEGGEARSLLVTVSRVDVNVGGGDDDDDGDDADPNDVTDPNDVDDGDDKGGGWVTVFTGPLEIDLGDATASAVLLGDGVDVEPGRVKEIRLVLEGDAVLVTGGTEQTIRCPSCTSSGLKIKAQQSNIVVEEGGAIQVNIVFDTVASVVAALDGVSLSPVIRLEATAKSDE